MSYAHRFDNGRYITGGICFGPSTFGVLAETIPSTGTDGPGYAYASLSFPGDTGKEIAAPITTQPTHGTLTADNNTAFRYWGTGVSDSAHAQLMVNGTAVGSPFLIDFPVIDPITLTPGSASIALAGGRPVVSKASVGALTPGSATIALAGGHPTVTQGASNLVPGTATFNLAGGTPTIAQAASNLLPGTATITLVGGTPVVSVALNLSPATAQLHLAGNTPFLRWGGGVAIYPGLAAQINLVGGRPLLTQGVWPAQLPENIAVVPEVGAGGFLRRFTKSPNADIDIDIDFNVWLSTHPGDELEDVGWDIADPDLYVLWPRIRFGVARLTFVGGDPGHSYTVTIRGWTSQGRDKQVTIQVRVSAT